MADKPTYTPAPLTEAEMATKALPDSAPGDVSDAESEVINDGNLSSPNDYEKIVGDLESGYLDDQINAEEQKMAAKAAPEAPKQDPEQPEVEGEQPAQPKAVEPELPKDLQGEEEDNGSDPIQIGVFPELNPDPSNPTLKVPEPKEPIITPPEAAKPAEPEAETPKADSESEEAPIGEQVDDKPPTHRVQGESDTDALALELMTKAKKNGNQLGLEDALKLAKETLGLPTETEVDNGDFAIPEGIPQTIEEINQEIENIEESELDLMEQMEFDKVREQRARKKELQNFIPKFQEHQSKQEQAYTTAFESSLEKAQRLYPEGKGNSEFAKEVAALDEVLKETGDSRYNDPNKPLLLYQQVAKRRGVFPSVKIDSPQGEAPKTTPTQPDPPARKYQAVPQVPVSGGSRTSGAQPMGDIQLENLNEDSYMALKESWEN